MRLGESEQCKFDGKYEKALELAEKVLMEDPACLEAAEEVADNLFSMHRYEPAKKAASYALSLSGESYIAHYILGFLHSLEEQWGPAVEHFLESNRIEANNPEILRCLGWSLFQKGEQEQGYATMVRAHNLRPNDTNTLCDLAACEIESQQFSKAKEYLNIALEIDASDYKAREMLAFTERLARIFE